MENIWNQLTDEEQAGFLKRHRQQEMYQLYAGLFMIGLVSGLAAGLCFNEKYIYLGCIFAILCFVCIVSMGTIYFTERKSGTRVEIAEANNERLS